jgi:hypothetical protein
MKNYYYLKLPANPLKDVNSLIEKHSKQVDLYDPYTMEPKEILIDSILQTLSNIGLNINFIVFFKTYNSPGDQDLRTIHSDIKWNGTEWEDLPFGINWEISDRLAATFQWWDMSAYPKLYPIEKLRSMETFAKLAGIHYGQRHVAGVPPQAILLDQADLLPGATLVRTDIPHSIIYKGFNRMSISIRFKENISWNDAVELFKPLMIQT